MLNLDILFDLWLIAMHMLCWVGVILFNLRVVISPGLRYSRLQVSCFSGGLNLGTVNVYVCYK